MNQRHEPTGKESRGYHWNASCVSKIEKSVDKRDQTVSPLQCQSAHFFTLKVRAKVRDAQSTISLCDNYTGCILSHPLVCHIKDCIKNK